MTQNTTNAPVCKKFDLSATESTTPSARRPDNLIDADAPASHALRNRTPLSPCSSLTSPDGTPRPEKITRSISRNRICSTLLNCFTEADNAGEFAELTYGAQIAIANLPQFDEQDKLTFRELACAIRETLFSADGGKA